MRGKSSKSGKSRSGFATYARQACAIAWTSFGTIAKSWGGLVLLAAIAILVALVLPQLIHLMEVPLLPRTTHVLTFLTAPLTASSTPWMIIPLLIVFYAGELVWRERDAGMSEITDATPVPEWVLFLGKFLGLSLVLIVWLAMLTTAGVLAQVRMGYLNFEIGLYLRTLFGFQLTDYLLFAVLALVAHVLVNHKHLGHLVALIAYGVITFPSALGIEHNLLVFGSGPGWSHTDMHGFGSFLAPWLWFKLYWAAWALLLALGAWLLWVRGKEPGLRTRFRLARRRFTRPRAWAAATAMGLVLGSGGFVFYNTNVLNDYSTASDKVERLAEYEQRYGRYEGIPQPRLTKTTLRVEIHPEQRAVRIRGTYHLMNNSKAPIDSVHLATVPEVETSEAEFNRPATRKLADDDLGHRIYALEQPLRPGDPLQLSFEINVKPHGFPNKGIDASAASNGTYFTNKDWLPAIGYQPDRELSEAGERRKHGLAPRPAILSLRDAGASQEWRNEQISVEAVVGTDGNQTAVAPGALRRTWTAGGRRYFHYSTDAPIRNRYAVFSAGYALHEGRWRDVAIQIFHHPGHTENLDRMARSVRASLDYYTQQFGPYPYRHIRLVERPGNGFKAEGFPINMAYDEGFSFLNPNDGPRGLDLPFYVVAHEVAHQWWGGQLAQVKAEGSVLLIESLAVYSGMQVLKKTYGQEHLRRYLSQVLQIVYDVPRTRADVPLLRANSSFHGYRKGPLALYALSQYIGEERVNTALRRLLQKHGWSAPSPPTSLDFYRELQAVTPNSFHSLLSDLFEANTFWELQTKRATAKPTDAGNWQVTLNVRARKVVVDSAGIETAVRMDDWVQIGVFVPAKAGEELGRPLYARTHRIRSGEQTITVTVPRKPVQAGIDPYRLLIGLERGGNLAEVRFAS